MSSVKKNGDGKKAKKAKKSGSKKGAESVSRYDE